MHRLNVFLDYIYTTAQRPWKLRAWESMTSPLVESGFEADAIAHIKKLTNSKGDSLRIG